MSECMGGSNEINECVMGGRVMCDCLGCCICV